MNIDTHDHIQHIDALEIALHNDLIANGIEGDYGSFVWEEMEQQDAEDVADVNGEIFSRHEALADQYPNIWVSVKALSRYNFMAYEGYINVNDMIYLLPTRRGKHCLRRMDLMIEALEEFEGDKMRTPSKMKDDGR